MKRSLSNVWAIVQKELNHYFVSPIAYVVMVIFLTVSGWFYYVGMVRFTKFFRDMQMQAQMFKNEEMLNSINLNAGVIAPALGSMVTIFLFLIPAIMMRSFAEEKRQKTDELLMTSPITVNELLMGKFFGSVIFLFLLLVPTALHTVYLFLMASKTPELGPVVTGYLGVFLFGTVGVAIGLFASSLTENQIIAYVVGFVVMLFMIIISLIGMDEQSFIFSIVKYLSIQEHMRNLLMGLVDTRDLVYFASAIAIFLFLTKRSLESFHWR